MSTFGEHEASSAMPAVAMTGGRMEAQPNMSLSRSIRVDTRGRV
jgi:hypothetical protein